MVRLPPLIAATARRFVLVRLTNLRGVDLNLFEFDYDLTWAAVFLNAEGNVYGRYGGRDADSPDTFLSLEGLQYALQAALTRHRQEPPATARVPLLPRRVEEYPAAGRLSERACIHCHQAYDFRREARQAADLWRQDELWVYPLPQNVGLVLAVKQGNRVESVQVASPAAQAGLRAGDVLQAVDGRHVASIADVQYALHRAPTQGLIPVAWVRDGKSFQAELTVNTGWRVTDISWRPSTRGLEPPPCVHGEDLSKEEKQALGLAEKRLAFRQGNFVTRQARQAGIRQNDIILGLDGELLEMTARQFTTWIRLHRKVGDRVIWNLVRDGTRLDLPMTLPGRSPF